MFSTVLAAAAFAASLQAPSPQPVDLAPGTRYDTRIPTLARIVGHAPGEALSTPEHIETYLRALHQAAPDRTRLIEYARSWEGRPLYVLVIGAPTRIAALDDQRAGLQRLAHPRGLTSTDAEALIARLPVVVWMLHSVHGDEVTSSDAALAEAYHLLAAQGDARVETILKESLVLIDPLQNPDGRARFLASFRQALGSRPDAEPWAAEHDEPWPSGRPNHYLFDMNRDWLAVSQVETVGRVKVGLDWCPQVVADLHEMGGDATYYFAPPAEPANPHITAAQRQWLTAFGRENARAFDQRGYAYFTREIFDAFYPGYGDSWPIYQGAIAMTFEQASPLGLAYRRDDDTVLTYAEGVAHHFTAAMTTLHTAAMNRERLLRDYLEYRRTAIAEGERGPIREYLVAPGPDPARVTAFAQLLQRHGIEVGKAVTPVTVAGRTLPAGSLVISAAQPTSRLLRNLMDPDIRMDDQFLKEQERRRRKRLGDQIYDVTAWSLPLLFDLDVVHADKPTGVQTTDFAKPAAAPVPTATAAYLMPWGVGAAGACAELLDAGVRVLTAGRAFTIGTRTFDVGTAIIRVAGNDAAQLAKLGPIAGRWGAEVVALDSTWVDSGMSLGSMEARLLKRPRVLLAWDEPVSTDSAGWARFALEQELQLPVSIVRTSSLSAVDLTRYNVIVLPSARYSRLGEEQIRRLKEWVSSGQVLITLAEASRWAASEGVGILATRTEHRDEPGTPAEKRETGTPAADTKPAPAAAAKTEPAQKPEAAKAAFDYDKAILPEREEPEAVPGALLRVTLDREHWLAAGLDGEVQAVVAGSRIFAPIKLDRGRNVGIYAPRPRLVAGGYAWTPSQDQLPQKAFLIDQPMGRGRVIAFSEDPNFRAIAPGTRLLFVNAVLLGPGMSGGGR